MPALELALTLTVDFLAFEDETTYSLGPRFRLFGVDPVKLLSIK